MRSKIIVVNAVVVLIVGAAIFALLNTSLATILQNRAERSRQVAQALQAANAQLALDALRLERWLVERVQTDQVRAVFSAGTTEARRESATAQANRLRDAAVSDPIFAKMAPSLVLFVDAQGAALGRNGSALMRGDQMVQAYPALGRALRTGSAASSVWLNRERQEQMLTSYAPVRTDEGEIAGAVVIGTPLNDERLARTSELTSGQALIFGVLTTTAMDVVAYSGGLPALVTAASETRVRDAAKSALANGSVTLVDGNPVDHILGAAPLEGYGPKDAVLLAAVPDSPVNNLAGVLAAPILGVTLLGLLLVSVAGFLLGNYISRPISELEDGLLSVINGNSDLRFQIEHPDLGGLVFRVNSLLNALMGVPEDTSDDEGRPSSAPSAKPFQEALSVDESSVAGQNVEQGALAALAAEPVDEYYHRLFGEYLQAKRRLGDPVDHISLEIFRGRIRASEREMSEKYGRPVRFQVELRDGTVVLIAVPLPA